jgi:hypothetical protein
MYEILKTAHHYLAFVTLALLAWAFIGGLIGTFSEKVWEGSHRKTNLFALIATHTMLLLGLVMLFITMSGADMGAIMKSSEARKAFVEHPTVGILAAVLVTIGNAKSKKGLGNGKKFKSTAIFFGLALLLVVSRLPWEKLF